MLFLIKFLCCKRLFYLFIFVVGNKDFFSDCFFNFVINDDEYDIIEKYGFILIRRKIRMIRIYLSICSIIYLFR